MDKEVVQGYVDALLSRYPELSTSELSAKLLEGQRTARKKNLENHEAYREHLRKMSEEDDRRAAAYRLELLAQCAKPNHLAAFKHLNKHLTSHSYGCKHWVVAGEAAKRFYREGKLPLQNFYIVLARTECKTLTYVNLLGNGDNVFEGYFLTNGVWFDIHTIRNNWADAAIMTALARKPNLPVVNQKHLDASGNWMPARLRECIAGSIAKAAKLNHCE